MGSSQRYQSNVFLRSVSFASTASRLILLRASTPIRWDGARSRSVEANSITQLASSATSLATRCAASPPPGHDAGTEHSSLSPNVHGIREVSKSKTAGEERWN